MIRKMLENYLNGLGKALEQANTEYNKAEKEGNDEIKYLSVGMYATIKEVIESLIEILETAEQIESMEIIEDE